MPLCKIKHFSNVYRSNTQKQFAQSHRTDNVRRTTLFFFRSQAKDMVIYVIKQQKKKIRNTSTATIITSVNTNTNTSNNSNNLSS